MHLYGYLCRPVTGAAGRAAGRREALGPNGQLVAFRLGTNGSIIYCKRLPVVRVFLREERRRDIGCFRCGDGVGLLKN